MVLLYWLGAALGGGIVLGIGLRLWDIYWEKQKL